MMRILGVTALPTERPPLFPCVTKVSIVVDADMVNSCKRSSGLLGKRSFPKLRELELIMSSSANIALQQVGVRKFLDNIASDLRFTLIDTLSIVSLDVSTRTEYNLHALLADPIVAKQIASLRCLEFRYLMVPQSHFTKIPQERYQMDNCSILFKDMLLSVKSNYRDSNREQYRNYFKWIFPHLSIPQVTVSYENNPYAFFEGCRECDLFQVAATQVLMDDMGTNKWEYLYLAAEQGSFGESISKILGNCRRNDTFLRFLKTAKGKLGSQTAYTVQQVWRDELAGIIVARLHHCDFEFVDELLKFGRIDKYEQQIKESCWQMRLDESMLRIIEYLQQSLMIYVKEISNSTDTFGSNLVRHLLGSKDLAHDVAALAEIASKYPSISSTRLVEDLFEYQVHVQGREISALHVLCEELSSGRYSLEVCSTVVEAFSNMLQPSIFSMRTSVSKETYLHILMQKNACADSQFLAWDPLIQAQYAACLRSDNKGWQINTTLLMSTNRNKDTPLHLVTQSIVAEWIIKRIPQAHCNIVFQQLNTAQRTPLMECLARLGTATNLDNPWVLKDQRKLISTMMSTIEYYPQSAWERKDCDGRTLLDLFLIHAPKLLFPASTRQSQQDTQNEQQESDGDIVLDMCIQIRNKIKHGYETSALFDRIIERWAPNDADLALWEVFINGRKEKASSSAEEEDAELEDDEDNVSEGGVDDGEDEQGICFEEDEDYI